MTACEKYIDKMNCYLDGELPASEISDLLAHLEECPACRARFEATRILSYEMRHLQKNPPPQLHHAIMNSVKSTSQKQPRSYFRIFASLAATAALLLFVFSGASQQLSGLYLFGQHGGEQSSSVSSGGAAVTSAPESNAAVPDAASRIVTQPPADAKDSTEFSDSGITQTTPSEKSSADTLYVPTLDTDESFAFYCIATGTGELPAEFSSENIITDSEKKQTYIYIDPSSFSQAQLRELLREAGFHVVAAPYHLPPTDSSASFGLIVIFG